MALDWYFAADADSRGDSADFTRTAYFCKAEESTDDNVPCRASSGNSVAAVCDGIGLYQMVELAAGVSVRDIGGVRVRITMWNMWISFLFQNDLNEFQ